MRRVSTLAEELGAGEANNDKAPVLVLVVHVLQLCVVDVGLASFAGHVDHAVEQRKGDNKHTQQDHDEGRGLEEEEEEEEEHQGAHMATLPRKSDMETVDPSSACASKS